MSLPDHVLSVVPVASQFSGSRALPVTGLVDYEVGGVALHNPSKGLLYQTWRARVLGQDILLGAPNTPEFVVYAGSATITEVSLAFDQNMRPTIAFVECGRAKLLWYDSAIPGETVTELAADVITDRKSTR